MQIINLKDIPKKNFTSPGGKYGCDYQDISEALGADVSGEDKNKTHPFDLELATIPAGKSLCPYHSHSAQWELYIIVGGKGTIRGPENTTEEMSTGDSFIFKPSEAHQISASSDEALTYYIVADNPEGETCYYPDSDKWLVRMGKNRHIAKLDPRAYFDDEE